MSERLEEGEGHAATDEHRVGPGRERAQDAELVLHLGAADDHDERPRSGASSSPVSTSTSRARRRPAAEGRYFGGPDHRGVRPMGDAEGVIDVERPGP